MSEVENIYHQINDTYSTLTLKSSNYQITTLINTCLVEKLKYLKWYRHSSTKYFVTTPTWKNKYTMYHDYNICIDVDTLLLHQFIMHHDILERRPNTTSIDHISRNTFDNRIENLRWASQAEQNHNRGKVSRKKTAQALPDDLKDISIPVYVTWNNHSETTKAGKVLQRSFFRIEKHPALGLTDKGNQKIWSSTKSSKVSSIDKFNDTLEQLEKFNSMLPEDSDDEIRKSNEKTFNELIAQYNKKTFNELIECQLVF